MLTSAANSEAVARASIRRLGEIDWDFTAQASESPFSSVHWHPCRFPSQIPGLAIGRLTAPGETILDPFMGSATTLVEAQRLGRRSLGIDINPVSCLLGRAKTLSASLTEINSVVSALRLKIRGSWELIAEAEPPLSVQAAKWYMPSTFSSLRRLRTVVQEARGLSEIIARACFSAILLSACREDRHWGYVCDNTRPIGNRAPDPRELFLQTLERFAAAYAERACHADHGEGEVTIVNDDAKVALSRLPDDLVDAVITSPPYYGVADYIKAQRLTMEWEEEAIEPLRRLEIGARSKRHRSDALNEYLIELDGVFRQVYRVLKKNGTALIIFGQSPSRPDAQTKFVENLTAAGFTLHLSRARNISVGRRQMPSLARETVLVVRK